MRYRDQCLDYLIEWNEPVHETDFVRSTDRKLHSHTFENIAGQLHSMSMGFWVSPLHARSTVAMTFLDHHHLDSVCDHVKEPIADDGFCG